MARLTAKQRANIPSEDFAGPDRTFPITDQEHLEDAASMLHHAANPDEVKKKAIRIAKRKGLTIPDSWKGSSDGKSVDMDTVDDGLLVAYGGCIKAQTDRESGWLGGNLVNFTDHTKPDQSKFKDFFTAKTDYDTELPANISVYYHHGLDPLLGQKRLMSGEIWMAESGIEIEAKLNLDEHIHRQLWENAERGDLGWSSGAIPWLVGRKAVGGTHEITQWPLKEASITPTPAYPNSVVALKSLVEEPSVVDLILLGGSKLETLGDIALDAIEAYIDRCSATKSFRDGKLSYPHRARLHRIKDAVENVMAETEPLPEHLHNDGATVGLAQMHMTISRALGVDI